MKSIYISDRLHRQAKLRAAEQGVPLNQLIAQLVEQGLLAQVVHPPQMKEPPQAYFTEALPITDQSSIDQRLGQLARDGILSAGRAASRSLVQTHRTAEPAEPLDAAQIRALFRRQREHHPDVPSAGEFLRQMREDES